MQEDRSQAKRWVTSEMGDTPHEWVRPGVPALVTGVPTVLSKNGPSAQCVGELLAWSVGQRAPFSADSGSESHEGAAGRLWGAAT